MFSVYRVCINFALINPNTKFGIKEMIDMKNYPHFFIMLILLLTMSGCTAALVGGGAAGGYAVGTDERPVDRMVDDSTITSHIKN